MPTTWQAWLEIFAVIAGLCYVVLAIRGQRSCWIAGLLSTLAYGVLCQVSGLWLQGALQVVYAVLAMVGWWQWRRVPAAGTSKMQREVETKGAHHQASSIGLAVHRLGSRNTLAALAFTALLTLVGYELLAASGSAQPWLEAATTAGGLVATYLATRKLLDNWSWWVVINVATAWLYWQAALRPTAGLYLAYAALAVLGWREWRKQLP
jgi:nicotinamide mononucleotide transporter